MSLFKLQEWWATKCGDLEEFDRNSMCIGSLFQDKTFIITGSFQGKLRIYCPTTKSTTDLILEMQLEQAILQVEIGKFISNTNALAVLMPYKLIIFSLATTTREDQLYYSLVKEYEHKLQRMAFNFCHGPFGGIYGKDFICIQSFDGQLSFFEQNNFTFSRFLSSKYLTPGPIFYSKHIDCFITYNSCMELECFRYQVLSSSIGSVEREMEESENQKSGGVGRKIQSDWSIVLGEEVYEITGGRFNHVAPSSQNEILVLGEHTLFCIKENGTISCQKRLDYFPSCFTVYNPMRESLGKHNLIIGTHHQTLMIYKDPKLIWSSKAITTPISIRVATFGEVYGMIVLLDENGNLSINYLGTDPTILYNPSIYNSFFAKKEVDFEYLEQEHIKLQQMIKSVMKQSKSNNSTVTTPMELKLSEPNCSTANNAILLQYKLFIKSNVTMELENIEISVPNSCCQIVSSLPSFDNGLIVKQEHHHTPLMIPFTISLNQLHASLFTNTRIRIIYSIQQENSTRMIHTIPFTIPFYSYASIVPSIKQSNYKLTFEVSEQLTISQLFSDLIFDPNKPSTIDMNDNRSFVSNIMSIKYTNSNMDATLLISKNNGRCRIQSTEFDGLWPLTLQLIQRLSNYKIQYLDELPLEEYFDMMEQHFQSRRKIMELHKQLSDAAQQVRSIQKRLLVRYKEKNPIPLHNLDVLLKYSIDLVQSIASQIEKQVEQRIYYFHKLCDTSLLLVHLIKLKIQLQSQQEFDILQQYFCISNDLEENEEVGWEEIMEANMTQLLREYLAKNTKEKNSQPQPLIFPKDTVKLKKHITMVIERLMKNGKLSSE